jgi:hypothetical protein
MYFVVIFCFSSGFVLVRLHKDNSKKIARIVVTKALKHDVKLTSKLTSIPYNHNFFLHNRML